MLYIFKSDEELKQRDLEIREEQLKKFLGEDTPEYSKAIYGREWATHYSQVGSRELERRRVEEQAFQQRLETARRLAMEKQFQEGQQVLKAQQEARERTQKAIAERQAQQEATRTGRTIQYIKEERTQQRAEEQRVIKVAEDIRASGKSYTRAGYQRELARRSGLDSSTALSRLQTGTKREAKIFRRTGISLEAERREEQQVDPLRQMLSVSAEEGSSFMEAPSDLGEDTRFSFRDIQYGYPLEEGRISPQAYVEYKWGGFTRRISDWIKERTPKKIYDIPLTGDIRNLGITAIETIGKPFVSEEKRKLFEAGVKEKREAIEPTTIGEFMFEKKIPFRVTDLAKFAFFAPAMLSTQATYAQAIQTGAVKPVVETRFRALVKPADKISKVEVYSTTTIGGEKVIGLSKQWVRQQGDDLIIGVGRGAVIKGKGAGARQITKFDILGVNKRLGTARAVSDISDDVLNIALKKDIGVGIKSRVITQQTEEILRREGVGLFKRYKTTQLLEKPVPSEIIGVIKPAPKEGYLYYIGKTGKPVTRISKYGIHYRLSDINVAGVIKTLKAQADDVTRMMSPAKITKTKLAPPIQESISAQVSSLAKQSEKVILKDIIKPSVTKTISRTKVYAGIIRGRQRFVDQTRRMFGEIDIQRFEPLGVLDRFKPMGELGRVKARVKARAKVRQVPKVKTKLKTLIEEKELLKQLTGVRTKQVYKVRQAQRMKTLLRIKLKFKPFETKLIAPPIVIPKGFIPPPIIPIPLFRMLLGKRKKKKRKIGKFRDALIYTPGFLARALGIKKKLTRKEMKERLEFGALGIREIPIFEEPIKIK